MDLGPSSTAGGPTSSRRDPAPDSSRRSLADREGSHACVFWLSGERYALDTVHVIEAITVNHMVPVPLSPPWLIGLTSLRGTPLPVVDLRAVLRLPAGRASRGSSGACQAVVLRVDGILVAGEVDRIEAVYALEGAQVAPGTGDEHAAVKGLLDAGRPDAPATLLDDGELARRVNDLRFRAKWEPGPLGD